jgi:2-isopropylmalate synthase
MADFPELRRITIFDTTLRDGEQAPGAALKPYEKLAMAKQLEVLGVDVVEAGFPVASQGDFDAVQLICRDVRSVQIAAITRMRFDDIDRTWSALMNAAHPRINLIISTSDIHLHHQLGLSRAEVVKLVERCVAHAKAFTHNVEVSAVDATRTDPQFLGHVAKIAIGAGATTFSIADTVGYAVPEEFGDLVRFLLTSVDDMVRVSLSVHCHDDLGFAVANSLAAVRAGAHQVKCTLNGLGERAGNAALEEIAVALDIRKDIYKCTTGINLTRLCESSRLLSELTGIPVQPHKAVVGANAFAHASGIHQDGIIKAAQTYEIIDPVSVGAPGSALILGKHSGRRALQNKLAELGYFLQPTEMDSLFSLFKSRADICKVITTGDLIEMVAFLTTNRGE